MHRTDLVAVSAEVKELKMAFDGFKLDSERYVCLMEKLIGETEYLQDNPPKFVPQEDRYSVIIAEISC